MFECGDCHKAFKTKAGLAGHRWYKHNGHAIPGSTRAILQGIQSDIRSLREDMVWSKTGIQGLVYEVSHIKASANGCHTSEELRDKANEYAARIYRAIDKLSRDEIEVFHNN